MKTRNTPMTCLGALLLTLGLALVAAPVAGAASADVAGKGKKTKVKVRVASDDQKSVLASGRLDVRVTSNSRRKTTIKLAAHQDHQAVVETDSVRVRKGKRKTVGLALSDQGRQLLAACGDQGVTAKGKYKRKGKQRRKTARDTGQLARDPSRCESEGQPQPPTEVDPNCDPIDAASCMLPYPNDYFTVADDSTDTGRRLDFHASSMPQSVAGVSIFGSEYNRNDGFSPNNTIVTRIPGIETQGAFDANGLVPQTDIGAHEDADQRVVLINAETGARHPIWAELDEIPDNDNQRLLIIHPAVALEYGARYVVALRNLTDAGGQPLRPNPIFKAYRDGTATGNALVEERRPHMEDLFDTLGGAGIDRDDLYLAWDFTVASEDNLTERLVAMRDDAFAQLGDTDLGDGEVQGVAPDLNDVADTEYILCESDGTPECEQEGGTYPGYDGTGPHNGDVYTGASQSDYVFKRVTGTITVPCYMDPPGQASNKVDPNVPCAAGARLHYGGDSELPSQNADETWEAPFTCVLPRTGDEADQMATGMPGVVFGHGLLQNHRIAEQLGLFPASMDGVSCSTDWIGLSAIDPITGAVLEHGDINFLVNLLGDLSKFRALPDRSQQGFVNTLYLGRAMAHPDGLADLPEFDEGAGSALDTDEELAYLGVSLGGIFGGATTSVAPDWERAVLSVPGMGFTTLLTRSTQFNQFLPLIYAMYPNPLERQVGISVLQTLWDRGEPSAYVHGITDGRFGTPPHEVMIHEAFGDHQVTNVQTEALARTLGAVVKTPALASGRSTDVEPFWGIQGAPSSAFNVPGGYAGPQPASLYAFDTGPIRVGDFDGDGDQEVGGTSPNPISNEAPVDSTGTDPANWNDGRDPHEPSATSPAAQAASIPFLLDQGTVDPCVDPAPSHPFSPPYTGTPEPCSAPPFHSIGEGL